MTLRTHWHKWLFCLAMAALAVRLGWLISVSATGWRPPLEHWREVAVGVMGVSEATVAEREPADQARHWLTVVSRIPAVKNDAAIAMGAAWMLDTPQEEFVIRYLNTERPRSRFGGARTIAERFDIPAINESAARFESQCREQRDKMIETALTLEPDDPHWRRATALLQFQTLTFEMEMSARSDNWRAVLAECASHDPQNALYDYLAALQFWTSSAGYEWSPDGYTLSILDPALFKEGELRLAAGLDKPSLVFDTGGHAATVAFLKATSVARTDYVEAAGSREIDSRAFNLLMLLLRWHQALSDVAERNGDYESERRHYENCVRLSDQIAGGNSPNIKATANTVRASGLWHLYELSQMHPELFTPGEAASIANDLLATKTDQRIRIEINTRLASAIDSQEAWADHWRILAMVASQQLCITALAFAALLFLARSVFQRNALATRGRPWSVEWLAWLAGLSVSFLIWGMCPAGIIPGHIQVWVLPALIVLIAAWPLTLVLRCISRWCRSSWIYTVAVFATVALAALVGWNHNELWTSGEDAFVTAPLWHVILAALGAGCALCLLARLTFAFFSHSDSEVGRRVTAAGAIAMLALPTAFGLSRMTHELRTRDADAPWIEPVVMGASSGLKMSFEELKRETGLQNADWTWALIQWHEQHGSSFAVLISVVFLWLVTRRCTSVADEGQHPDADSPPSRSHPVVAACIRFAAASFLVYLIIAPHVVRRMEAYYLRQYDLLQTYTGDGIVYDRPYREIEADGPLVEQFRTESLSQMQRSIDLLQNTP